MNHELIRLAAYLQADSIADRALDFLASDKPEVDRTLVAMCLQFLSHDWNAEQRFKILKYYENAANSTASSSLAMYLMNVTRDFAKSLSDEDVMAILEQGAVWRNAALAAIYKLPRPIDDETAATLRELDRTTWSPSRSPATSSDDCAPASSRCWPRQATKNPAPTCEACGVANPNDAPSSPWRWHKTPRAKTGTTWFAA